MPAPPTDTLTLYDYSHSGHCHRVRLLLSLLGLSYEVTPVNLLAGEHRSPTFAALNPAMQVPVLRVGNRVLADSIAIMVFLAKCHAATTWLPEEPFRAASVQRWFSFAARELTQGPALARSIMLFRRPGDLQSAQLAAHQALARMHANLQGQAFLAGDGPTLADVACYAYAARAPEGGVSLEPYPMVQDWLARVESLPHFVPMPEAPLP